MKLQDNKIIPYRIRQGRISREMSIIDLADNIGVTRQLISQYELGRKIPSADTFYKICNVLKLPKSFFYKESEVEVLSTTLSSYRSSSTTRKKYKNGSEQRMYWALEIYNYLLEYIDFPEVNIPSELMKEKEIYSTDEIEEITISLREAWNLGSAPIENLISLLHLSGVLIACQDIKDNSIEAFSRWIGDVPIIVINRNWENPCRLRFTIAHELGHLILHSYTDDPDNKISKERLKEMEKEAHRFASAFLLPEASFVDDVFSASPESLLHLKPKWKVSVQAMLHRCLDLGIITENQHTYGCKIISKKGWRHQEPYDFDIAQESPYMLKQAIELLLNEKVVNKAFLAKNICLFPEEIEELCNLPSGLLKNEQSAHKLKLTLMK